ncbi:metallophosphoesterase [Methanobrevibacter sp.]|uniref:metallophosphoesterase n=1 Tax=Methanobrevibacter sp. TaxID=66852 RepID=UPI0038661B6D
MSFRTRRVLFMTPFYMIFQFFLMKYLFLLIGGLNDVYLVIFAIFIGLLHVVPMLFEAKKSRKITRFLQTIDGVWMWASLILLIDILAIYLIGIFVELPKQIILMFLAIVPILGVYNYFKAHKLVVNERVLKMDNLARDINIVHLSDVHFGSVRHKQIIRQIANKLMELEKTCEIVIISGDLADGSSVVEKDDFDALKEIDMPIIFTPGNHDFYPGIENVVSACRNAGIIVLDNDKFEYKNLNIYGLTFSFDEIEMPTVDEIKEVLNHDMINIINYHVPYYWEEFSSLGFDIQLSGHTHGGQFYPAVNFANRIFEYNKGLFKNKLGKYLHVTTGVGSMDTPMRWGTDSELVILKLRKR